MKPARHTISIPSRAQRFVKRSLKRFAVFAELAVIDQRRRNALFAGVGETGGVGPVRNDKRNFGGIVIGLGGFNQRRHVRAAAGNKNCDSLLDHCSPGKIEAAAKLDTHLAACSGHLA